jgi:hypothetical protein
VHHHRRFRLLLPWRCSASSYSHLRIITIHNPNATDILYRTATLQ